MVLEFLSMVQLRDVIDPKQHYKKNDTKGVPKFFQVRIVVKSALL